jgi:type I restriction enzyme R subunit
VQALPEGIRKHQDAVAETIENNVRRLIIDESPINPKYYERMSELLDALIAQRRQDALEYRKYLAEIIELTRKVKNGPGGQAYPKALDTQARRALYDNLGKDEALALAVDAAVLANRQDGWRSNPFKLKRVKLAIREAIQGRARVAVDAARTGRTDAGQAADHRQPFALPSEEAALDALIERLLELVKNQREY